MLNSVVQIVTVLLHTDVSNDTEFIALPVQHERNFSQLFVIAKNLSVGSHPLVFGAGVT